MAFPVVVLGLMVGAAWAVGALVFPVGTWLARRWPWLARGLPLVAAVPLLAALVCGAAAVLPGDPHLDQPVGCHCAASMPGWSHLCPAHPAAAMGLVPLAVAVLALWLPGWLGRVRALGRLPWSGGAAAGAVVQTRLSHPTALLVGWLRPVVVVDSRLWGALSPAARGAVLAHERGHLARRDPLVLMALRVLGLAAPRGAAVALARAWLDHAEDRADALAVCAVGDPLVVAEALLRCARLGAPPAAVAVGWGGGSLERRVERLLGGGGVREVSAAPDLGLRELGVLGAAGAGALAAAPWVHHQIEHLLNLGV